MLFAKSHKVALAILLLLLLIISVLIGIPPRSQPNISNVQASLSRLLPRGCDGLFQGESDVSCFYYRTHDSGGFKLPLALIKKGPQQRRSAISHERELMIYIPGGPGQGYMTSADEITYWVEWLEANDQEYDLLLFDPRGTGESIPSATCENYQSMAEHLLAQAVETEIELLQMNTMLSECLDKYAKVLNRQFPERSGAALYDVFATRNQVEDIKGMITSLGYQRAHLWGVSYGTRFASAASQLEVVKTLILDSYYPFDKGLASDWIDLYYDSFKRHQILYARFLDVSNIHEQGEITDTFKDLYQGALNILQDEPLTVDVELWRDERKITFALTAERLLELSFSNLYFPHRYRAFYMGLEFLAETGRANNDLLGVVEYFVNNVLDENFSFITYYAVECLDNQAQYISQADVSFDTFPIYEPYFYLGFKHALCDKFGFSKGLDVQRIVVNHNKPTLIFSGEYDPVTPSGWAKELSKQRSNIRHIELKNTGHAQLRGQQCNWSMLNDFIREQVPIPDIQCEASSLWH